MAQFTSANAREMAAKGNATLKARRNLEKNRLALVDELLAKAALPTAPAPALPEPPEPPDVYLASRLTRVRTQIDMLSDMIDAETDAAKMDRLVNALYRMQDVEQKLAGRPGPGTLKPRSPDALGPRDSRPASVPQAPQVPSVPQANQVPQAPSVTPSPQLPLLQPPASSLQPAQATSLPPPPQKLQ